MRFDCNSNWIGSKANDGKWYFDRPNKISITDKPINCRTCNRQETGDFKL